MMRTRSAMSIAELLVTMSACSVILTMSAGLIHRSMHTQSNSRDFYDAERTALRLGRQFRHDVHASTAASVTDGDRDEKVVLRLQLQDGRTVEYSRSAGHVLRLLSQEGEVAARDEFPFPSPIELEFHEAESATRIILAITTERDGNVGARATSCDLHVEAALNRAPHPGETR